MESSRSRPGHRTLQPEATFDPVMRFTDEGLVLGTGTVLARKSTSAVDVLIDVDEPRLVALLTAAHLRTPTCHEIAHVRKAAERWRHGESALAAMHLALSRLDRLINPVVDAERLFLADGLLEAGLPPDTLLKALEPKGPSSDGIAKYDPDEPRVPAGNGRTSGQWTVGAGSAAHASPPAARPSERPARRLKAPHRQIGAPAPPANRPNAASRTPAPMTGNPTARTSEASTTVGSKNGSPLLPTSALSFRWRLSARRCQRPLARLVARRGRWGTVSR